jgi:uncharacterized membrane protein
LAGLIAVGVIWELWLAPLRPGGSWLALKVVPLALLAPGVLRRDPATLQWALLAMPLYVGEGVVRLFEAHPAATCAAIEVILGATFFAAAVAVLRPLKRAARQRTAAAMNQAIRPPR